MNNFNIYVKVLSNIRKFDDMNLVNNKDIHFLKLNNMIIIFTPLLLFIIISLICGYDTKIFLSESYFGIGLLDYLNCYIRRIDCLILTKYSLLNS